jgi:spore coat protein B
MTGGCKMSERSSNGNSKKKNVEKNNYASLLNQYVTMNGNGPEKIEGVLLGVGKEHVALKSDNGIMYYNLRHIKSISNNFQNNSNDTTYEYEVERVNSFKDVLKKFRHKWVKINGSKKDAIEGFLSEVFDDHVVMINNGEVFYVLIYHIKNITEATKSNDNNNNNNNTQQQSNQNKNQSSEKQSNPSRRADFIFNNRNLFRL